jgi:pimeloyl-ACP methyl ester carboxylesterase
MTREREVRLRDGRTLRVHDTGGDGVLTVVWHHGSPQTGALLAPLVAMAADRDVRLVSYGRPAYGGSSPLPGRDVASAGHDVAQLADALGVDRFAVMGASGGGPHALACAAVVPQRVTGVVCLAGIAPFTGEETWFAGMASDGGLRAAAAGRAARARYAEREEFDPSIFTAADRAALDGTWAALGEDAQRAGAAGPEGLVDDDVAFVVPWGVDLAAVTAPVLLVQGGQDRVVPPAHAELLARRLARPQLWLRPDDGHVSVLDACPAALDWLVAQQATTSARNS